VEKHDVANRCGRSVGLVLTAALFGCGRAAITSVPTGGDSQPLAPADSFDGDKAGDERAVAGIKLCWCPAGRFIMGSPRDEPERRPGEDQVEVTLTKGFWMAKYARTRTCIPRRHRRR
jgi:formylglycine-generating enzyme required for sulfatase activity